MNEHKIIGEVELSVEELRCLEAHFRQTENDAAVQGIKETFRETADLSGKMRSELCSVEHNPPAA